MRFCEFCSRRLDSQKEFPSDREFGVALAGNLETRLETSRSVSGTHFSKTMQFVDRVPNNFLLPAWDWEFLILENIDPKERSQKIHFDD